MIIPLKQEPNSDHLSFACPHSLRTKLKEFAAKEGVTESAAARHIMSLFFDNDCNKTEVDSSSADRKSLKTRSRKKKVTST